MGTLRMLGLSLTAVLVAGAALTGCTAAPNDATSGPTGTATSTTTSTPSSTSPPSSPAATTETVPIRTDLPSTLLGGDWERIETTEKIVALTFDGGSSDAAVDSVLATLAASQVPATFFLTGDFARAYPERVSQIAAAGHRFGNHSDQHEAYPSLTNEEITADLARVEQAIAAGGGSTGKPFFRFPFGERTPEDIQVVNDNGYACIRWTVDTLGWKGTSGGITADIVRQRVLDGAQPGEIVLMHLGANPDDGSTLDADALPGMIQALRDMGYTFVTLEAMLD